MKQKFTTKQVAAFQSMINNGILKYIANNHEESETILTNVVEKFAELDEGKYLRYHITDSQSIEAADERGELGCLADDAIYRYCKDGRVGNDFANSVLKSLSKGTGNKYACFDGIDYRRSFIDALGLRKWASKEDIIKEIEWLIG